MLRYFCSVVENGKKNKIYILSLLFSLENEIKFLNGG